MIEVMKMRKKRYHFSHPPTTERSNTFIYYLFPIALLITGFVSGNAVSYELNNRNLLSVINPIITNINNLNVSKSFIILIRSFFKHFTYLFAIWFLAFTIIGIILVVFIVFFIGFIYGLVISSFSYQLGLSGFMVGFFYTFPQNIIILPLVIYMTSQSLRMTVFLFRSIIQMNSRLNLRVVLNEYYQKLLFCVGVLIIYAFVVTIFGRYFVSILKSLI